MASVIYASFLDDLAKGNIDLDSDTFYSMLVTSSYAENANTHTRRSDVTNEVPATGTYVAGGSAVTFTLLKDTTNNREDWTISNQVYAASVITMRKQVVYKHRGGASSDDELVACFDQGSDVASSGGTLTLPGSTIRIQR